MNDTTQTERLFRVTCRKLDGSIWDNWNKTANSLNNLLALWSASGFSDTFEVQRIK